MNKYEQYVASFKADVDPFIRDMEEYATEHHIPIMDCAGIETFIGLLRIQNPKRILEIGSAIGYSAIRIAEALPETTLVTIERDTKRYTKAVEFIEKKALHNRIHIIEADALLTESTAIFNQTYDALFIDAAKGQYRRFFEKYSPMVVSGGVIYCDNMFMHGVVLHDIEEIPRRNRTMIRNLKEFTQWIMAHSEYETSLLPIGDGLLIAVKK